MTKFDPVIPGLYKKSLFRINFEYEFLNSSSFPLRLILIFERKIFF